jgi:uncharacterized protein YjlB
MAERLNKTPHILHFVLKRNKNFPNSELPVLVYQKALNLPEQKGKAATIIQKIFARNDWTNSWRNSIYDFHHYHSVTHECMGIGEGSATIILGGPGGKRIKLSQGDIIIIPAGVAHKCLQFSPDFLCVGAYPQGKDFDIKTGTDIEYKQAKEIITKLANPQSDPVFGEEGFLKAYWNNNKE